MVAPRRVLVDTSGPLRLNVVEGKNGGALVVEGKIGHCDVPTANGRVYPRSIMEREIKRLKPRIEQASVYAAVDHPGDGKTRLKDAGAIVRDLWIEQSGAIHGKFEVVSEAPAGQAIAAFLRRGASVGMSSRGLGSTTSGPNGYDVVGEDFRLNTWDFVSDPACHDAYPAIVSEDEEQKITEDHLRARFPKIVQAIEEKAYATAQQVCEEVAKDEIRCEVEKQAEEGIRLGKDKLREDVKLEVADEIRAQLREDFATKLVRAIAEMREKITEEVKSDLASDPAVAGARLTLSKITEMLSPYKPTPDVQKMLSERDSATADLQKAITERDKKIKEQAEQVARVEQKARTAIYALYVEQKVGAHPAAAEIKKLIGDMTEIKSVDDLKIRVDAAIEQAQKTTAVVKEQASEEIATLRATYERKLREKDREVASAKAQSSEILKRVEAIEQSFHKVLVEKDAAVAAARAELADREEELAEALEQTTKAALIAYANERCLGHKKGPAIIKAIVEGRITSKEGVDKNATRLEEGAQEPGGVRERVRRAMSRGRETMTEDESKAADAAETADLQETGEAANDLREIGGNLTEAVALAGATRPSRR